MSSTVLNLERIVGKVEQHDATCTEKAKGVALNAFEKERLGFEFVTTKEGNKVPVVEDGTLGTGRFRVLCDGYHGPKPEVEEEESIQVEAPSPAERELVPAGIPEETDDKAL